MIHGMGKCDSEPLFFLHLPYKILKMMFKFNIFRTVFDGPWWRSIIDASHPDAQRRNRLADASMPLPSDFSQLVFREFL